MLAEARYTHCDLDGHRALTVESNREHRKMCGVVRQGSSLVSDELLHEGADRICFAAASF